MRPDRLTLASWLCALPGLFAAIASFTELIPQHAFDKSWPPHARFHLTWAAGKLFALGINQMLLAFIPLRAGQRWSWYALAINFVFGGLMIPFASRLQVGPLRPLSTHDRWTRLQFIAALMSTLGLVLSYGAVSGKQRARAS